MKLSSREVVKDDKQQIFDGSVFKKPIKDSKVQIFDEIVFKKN